jgi:hypothetical protein
MKNEINNINDEQIKALLKTRTKVSTSDSFVDSVMSEIHNIEAEKEKKSITYSYYLSWVFTICAVILSFFVILLLPEKLTIGNRYTIDINSVVLYLPISLVGWLLIDNLVKFHRVEKNVL